MSNVNKLPGEVYKISIEINFYLEILNLVQLSQPAMKSGFNIGKRILSALIK